MKPGFPPARVSLCEIAAETLISVRKLDVDAGQQCFVTSNAVSLAQALFATEAWYRAIYADDEPAGFVMREDTSLRSPPPEKAPATLWRLTIKVRFQGKGIGRAAMQLVITHAARKALAY